MATLIQKLYQKCRALAIGLWAKIYRYFTEGAEDIDISEAEWYDEPTVINRFWDWLYALFRGN